MLNHLQLGSGGKIPRHCNVYLDMHMVMFRKEQRSRLSRSNQHQASRIECRKKGNATDHSSVSAPKQLHHLRSPEKGNQADHVACRCTHLPSPHPRPALRAPNPPPPPPAVFPKSPKHRRDHPEGTRVHISVSPCGGICSCRCQEHPSNCRCVF